MGQADLKEKEKIENIEEIDKKEKKITRENINRIANRFFNSIGFPIFIGMLLLFKTLFFYTNTISIRETIDKATVLGTIAFLATVFCMICALPNRGRSITTIVVDILLSIIIFADNVDNYIYVLTENGIEERGTHQELVEKNGIYSKLNKK